MKTFTLTCALLLLSCQGIFAQSKTLNLTVFLQGLYNGSSTMNVAKDENGPHWGANIADKLTIELYSAPVYSILIFSDDALLSTSGIASISVPTTYNGEYYVTIRHRNHLLTTTKFPVSFAGDVINLTFNSPEKVYGNNMVMMPDGIYVLYVGDVNQDGLADGTDLNEIGNMSDAFSRGYLSEDLNGDGLVDGSDLNIEGNWTNYFIKAFTPNLAVDGQPCPGTPVLIDTRDGKIYNTVSIGSQCWMAQNLNTGKRIRGDSVQTNNGKIEKYCYNNDETNCDVYGGLYLWKEWMNYTTPSNLNPSNRQGICPAGWHIPSDGEWCQMEQVLESTIICNSWNWHGDLLGGKLKESGTVHWDSPNTGATNESGFTVLPGGYRYPDGNFRFLHTDGYIWTSQQGATDTSYWYRAFQNNFSQIYRHDWFATIGFSGRCVRDCSSSQDAPTEGTHIPSKTQIIWNWSAVPGAIGYKWNTVNDYNTATDMGTLTTKTETGLTCSTAYTRYVWAYNACLNSLVVPLNKSTYNCVWTCGEPMTDSRDTKTYNTVQIGTQCWMQQNLNYGNRIDGMINQTNNNDPEKYCYSDLESNCNIYGGFYQWNEAMQYVTTEGTKGICPDEWHLPTETEWCTLEQFIDVSVDCNASGWIGTVVGGSMKESGTTHWSSPNAGATNSSGFNGLGSGYRSNTGPFLHGSLYAPFWSSTEFDATNAWHMHLYFDYQTIAHDATYKTNGFSVRCIKN
jgi:uncharacterized protein (TIGR02145 family)